MPPSRRSSKVTIKDIAREANVSYSTVSRALNDHAGTSAATKAKIRAVAERMGYQANTLARSLAMNQSKMVGVLFPDLGNEFFTDILRAVSRTLAEAGYGVLIYETNWEEGREQEALRKALEKMVDGLVLYPNTMVGARALKHIRRPVVVLQHQPTHELQTAAQSEDSVPSEAESAPDPPRAFISADDEQGGVLIAEHIAACGYRRPIYLGGPVRSESNHMRRRGITRRLAELGFPPLDERWGNGAYAVKSGYLRWRELYKVYSAAGTPFPDAVIAGNDQIAIGCMQGVAEAGLRPGEDVGVTGFDNAGIAGLPQIQLTTIHLPSTVVGREAAEQLLRFMEEPQRSATEYRLLEPRLIVRRTTRSVRA